jgi:hypothetical protein
MCADKAPAKIIMVAGNSTEELFAQACCMLFRSTLLYLPALLSSSGIRSLLPYNSSQATQPYGFFILLRGRVANGYKSRRQRNN